MTIIEAITKIDALKPTNYTTENKVAWLSMLDGVIKKEIIDTHEGADKVTFVGYDSSTPSDTMLLIPAPYDDIYVRWLEAQIDYANGEFNKYNASMSMHNTYMTSFINYYNRNNMPLQKNGLKYFYLFQNKVLNTNLHRLILKSS